MAILTESQMANVQEVVRPFGLQVAGGSIEKEDGKAYVSLNRGAEATFNKKKVAEVLMQTLEVHTIILDGETFSI